MNPIDDLDPQKKQGMFARAFEAAYQFWTKPIRAEPLALFRILIGAVLFLSITTSFATRLVHFLGPDRVCPPANTDAKLERRNAFSIFRGPTSIPILESRLTHHQKMEWRRFFEKPVTIYWLCALWALVSLSMTVGFCTRISTFLTWVLSVSFFNRLDWLTNGGDLLTECALFYMLFAPMGKVWSIDSIIRRRWRRRRGVPEPTGPVLIRPWIVRLIQIQICVVYLFSGVSKLAEDWLNGTAVFWVLNDVNLTRIPYSWFPIPLYICRVLSWSTLVFEIGFSFFVCFRLIRPWLLLGGVLFHLGIAFHLEIGYFSYVTLSFYVLFLQGETLARFFAWFRKKPDRGLSDSGIDLRPTAT